MKMGHIGYDPIGVNVDLSVFNDNADWTEFYGNVEEELTPNIPEPHDRSLLIHSFVDTNHAGNVVTRLSNNVIIMFIQNAPIIWFSKIQNTFKAATFGSELVALII